MKDEQITIRVTRDHILKGKPGEGDNCPVWHACMDAGFDMIHVNGELCWVEDDIEHHWVLPENVQSHIEIYDTGGSMKPFEFTIRRTETTSVLDDPA